MIAINEHGTLRLEPVEVLPDDRSTAESYWMSVARYVMSPCDMVTPAPCTISAEELLITRLLKKRLNA